MPLESSKFKYTLEDKPLGYDLKIGTIHGRKQGPIALDEDANKFIQDKIDSGDPISLDKNPGESNIAGTFFDHLVNSASMGLVGDYEDWQDKTTGETIAAGIAETIGMFMPMGWIGKAFRGGKALVGAGSVNKAIQANKAIRQTGKAKGLYNTAQARKVITGTTRKTGRAGIGQLGRATYGSFKGRRLMYQYEMGGEVMEQASKQLRALSESRIAGGLTKIGVKKQAAKAQARKVFDAFDHQLRAGKTINTSTAWGTNLATNIIGRMGGLGGKWHMRMGRYFGEVVQDMAVLNMYGIGINYVRSIRRPDEVYTDENGIEHKVNEFKPVDTFTHGAILSFAFPAIRAIRGGGEMRFGEVWNAVLKPMKKTNYSKVAAGKNGQDNLLALLRGITGGKRSNLFGKTRWTAKKSGKSYDINEIKSGAYATPGNPLGPKEVVDDVVDIMNQMKKNVSHLNRAKVWGKAYAKDTFNKGSFLRMSVGAFAMNVDFLNLGESVTRLRGMPVEQMWSHLITGALMSRGRGGWAHDPQNKTMGARATELNDMYSLMHYMGINHKNVSNYMKVSTWQRFLGEENIGLHNHQVTKQVNEVFERAEEKFEINKRVVNQSKTEDNDQVLEWKTIADKARGIADDTYDPLASRVKLYTPEEKQWILDQLSTIKFEDKGILDISSREFEGKLVSEQVKPGGEIETMFKDFLQGLSKDSEPGANDKIIEGYWSSTKNKFEHGGIEQDIDTHYGIEVSNLLSVMNRNNKAEKIGSLNQIRLNDKAKARLESEVMRFKNKLVRIGMGPDVEYSFDLGSRYDNPFLERWMNGVAIHGQQRLGDIVTNRVSPENRMDEKVGRAIYDKLVDEDGRIAKPEFIKIMKDDGTGEVDYIERADLYSQVYGIADAWYRGADRTKQKPHNRDFPMAEKEAKELVDAYEGLGLGISPERLVEHQDYLHMRSVDKMNLQNINHISTIKQLEEANLVVRDSDANKIRFSSQQAVKQMVRETLGDPMVEEIARMHQEIIDMLPGRVVEISNGKLDIDDAEINIEAIRTTYHSIPEIYNKEIIGQFKRITEEGLAEFDYDAAKGSMDLIVRKLKEGKQQEAILEVEQLREYVKPKNRAMFDELIAEIQTQVSIKGEGPGIGLELLNAELSDGSGKVNDALDALISSETYASQEIESLLASLVTKGPTHKYGQILMHGRLIDNLSRAIGAKKVSQAPISELIEAFRQDNSVSSLRDVLKGIDAVNAKYNVVNERDASSVIDAYKSYMENNRDFSAQTRQSILSKYGLLDTNQEILPKASEMIKLRDYDKLKQSDMIPDNLKNDPNIDNDFLMLDNIIRNSVGVEKVRITEKWDANDPAAGEAPTRTAIREWVSKDDNTEFKTPGYDAIEGLQSDGNYKLVKIDKIGTINGKKVQISTLDGENGQPNIREIATSNRAVDQPEQRYIDELVKRGVPYENANYIKNRSWISEEGAFLDYIELSLGSPYFFVNSKRSVAELNKQYRKWYDRTEIRLNKLKNIDGSHVDNTMIQNFKKVFDPKMVQSGSEGIELKLRAMYSTKLNTQAFDKLWTREVLRGMTNEGGHNDLGMKLLKYNKLAEGGSWKQIARGEDLRDLITALPNIEPARQKSMINILQDIESGVGIKVGFLADEAKSTLIKDQNGNDVMWENPLTVRNIVNRNINDRIKGNDNLKNELSDRYSSQTGRFTAVLDKSGIDGAIPIDTDMRNLMQAELNLGKESNGIKGSIAKSGENDLIHIYGKGLFIYNPRWAKSMEAVGMRMLVPESAGKNFFGKDATGLNQMVEPKKMEGPSMQMDLQTYTDRNMMVLPDLDGIGLRFGGHLGNNASVPHPWTHYLPKDLVVGIREGYQALTNNIKAVADIDGALKRSDMIELANHINEFQKENSYLHEVGVETFNDFMLKIGGSTRNETIRKGIIKTFEEQSLPTLVKPKNKKVAYEFLVPDLRAETPLSIDMYVHPEIGAEPVPVTGVRLQMGEASINEASKYMPIDGVDDMLFSFRSGNVDYTLKRIADGEYEVFSPVNDYLSAGASFRKDGLVEMKYENKIYKGSDIKKNKELDDAVKFIEALDMLSNGKGPKDLQKDFDALFPQGIMDNYSTSRIVEHMMGKKIFKDLQNAKFGLVGQFERGPRRGRSDFILARIRQRKADEIGLDNEGTVVGLNVLDVHGNAQGDHDGDKLRWTMSFGKINNSNHTYALAKQAYRDGSIDEEFETVDISPRQTNLFGVEYDAVNGVQHAGSSRNVNLTNVKAEIQRDQRLVGKMVKYQGALEWMYLTGIKIDGDGIRNRIGFTPKKTIEHGDIVRRFTKGNQSIQDYIKNVSPVLKGNKAFQYWWMGKGENQYQKSVFETIDTPNSVKADILEEVTNVLGSPNKLFNQVWGDGGGRAATSYDIASENFKLRKFFSNPTKHIFYKLLNRYTRDGVLEQKMPELMKTFFEGDLSSLTYNDKSNISTAIFKKKGIKLNKTVISFEEGMSADALMKASNLGFFIDGVTKKKLYQNVELDNAWRDVSNIGDIKKDAELFLDDLAALRALGFNESDQKDFYEMRDNEIAFKFDKNNTASLSNIEHASLMHHTLELSKRDIRRSMDKLSGYKNPNRTLMSRYAYEIDAIEKGQKYIESIRTAQVIEDVMKSQKPQMVVVKKGNRGIANSTYQKQYVYRISGNLVDADNKPNFKALSYVGSVAPKKGDKNGLFTVKKGKYLVLKNPLVSHSFSKEKSIEGLAWHYAHNNMPLFTDRHAFMKYQDMAGGVRKAVRDGWKDALEKFRTTAAIDPFSAEYRDRFLIFKSYFEKEVVNGEISQNAGVDQLTKKARNGIDNEFDLDKAMVYYKAKLLLTPQAQLRHYIKSTGAPVELPYFRLNERVFKGVFEYLKDTGNRDVAELLMKEYNGTRDFLAGYTNEATIKLNPSPLYLKSVARPERMTESLVETMLSGIQDISGLAFKRRTGLGVFIGGNEGTGVAGEWSIKKVRNVLDGWKDETADNSNKRCL